MITDYLDAALGEGIYHKTKKGTQYSYKCPFCNDHKDRLFVNIDRKVFFCHNCEATGSMITFLSDYNKIDWKKALSLFREYEGYDVILPDDLIDEIYTKLKGKKDIAVHRHVYPLPEEFILIEEARGRAGQAAVDYLRSRGVSMRMAERYYIGYCAEGNFANRIIMPDFENGELVYWQARTWLPEPTNVVQKKFYRKVLNPSLSEEEIEMGLNPIDKSEVVGNIDLVLQNRMAVLCEGKFDQYAIGDTGACIYGKHISDEQFVKLVSNKDKIDVVAVMLDDDAFRKTIATAAMLYKHFDDVLVCKLEEGQDPSSMGHKGVLEALNNSIKYSPMFEVKARLKGWI